MNRTLTAAILGTLCAIGAGCASDGSARTDEPPAQETPAMEQISGTLKSGFAGIGGEHTGWVILVPDEGGGSREKQIEVEVSKVAAMAKVKDGQPVTAEGAFVEKRYVERGVTRIFVIERFWTCFEPGA